MTKAHVSAEFKRAGFLALIGAMHFLGLAGAVAQSSYVNPTLIAINDSPSPPTQASPFPSALQVSKLSGLVEGVTVTLSNVHHTFPHDLSVLLAGPQGQTVVLMSDTGDGTDLTKATLTFSDYADGYLPQSGAITTGTFKPSADGSHAWPWPVPAGPHATDLSAFYGTVPNGTWNLYAMDNVTFDSGFVSNGWQLTITTAANLPPVLSNLSVTPAVAENGIATLAGAISDPNAGDSFTLSVNWGDTPTNQTVALPAGTINYLLNHRYLDDGPKGTPSANYQVMVTVTDSAGPSDDGFLSALFQDLLARPFDPALRGFYESQLVQQGGASVAYELLTGHEYRAKRTMDYYRRYLQHYASQGDQDFIVFSALTEREIVSFILAGTEYFNTRAGNDPSAWLDAVFYDLLNRPLTPAERIFYLAFTAQNGRGAAVDTVLAGQEFRQAAVEAWFQKFLRRAGGASAAPFVSALAKQTWEQILAQILGSAEYYTARGGGTASGMASITVTNMPPVLKNVTIPSALLEGGIAGLSGQFFDPGTQDAFTVEVDWGDGSPLQTTSLTNGATSFSLAHLFSVPHTTNLVHLSLSDDDGGVVTQVWPVIVNERAPRITGIARQPGSISKLDCLGVPARAYTLQASTNLASATTWFSLGQSTAAANGAFTGYDMAPANVPQRFYRLRSP